MQVETDEFGTRLETGDLGGAVLLEVEALQVGEQVEVLYLLETYSEVKVSNELVNCFWNFAFEPQTLPLQWK